MGLMPWLWYYDYCENIIWTMVMLWHELDILEVAILVKDMVEVYEYFLYIFKPISSIWDGWRYGMMLMITLIEY